MCGPKPLPACAGFQVGDSNAEQPSSLIALERLGNGHLVGLQLHGGKADVGAADQLEAFPAEEQGTAIWAVVVLHIQAWRPWLWEEGALVT